MCFLRHPSAQIINELQPVKWKEIRCASRGSNETLVPELCRCCSSWSCSCLRKLKQATHVGVANAGKWLSALQSRPLDDCTFKAGCTTSMVLLHVKVSKLLSVSLMANFDKQRCLQRTEDEQFLCELPVATSVTDATSQLVALQNLRTRIHR